MTSTATTHEPRSHAFALELRCIACHGLELPLECPEPALHGWRWGGDAGLVGYQLRLIIRPVTPAQLHHEVKQICPGLRQFSRSVFVVDEALDDVVFEYELDSTGGTDERLCQRGVALAAQSWRHHA